jgi:Brp/Blh family beta-carotene 15,15'-monooxygenase
MALKSRLYDVILILSFLALWLSSQIAESFQFVLGYFLILSIGVGHGANDLKIFFNNTQLSSKKSVLFIIAYSVCVIGGFLLFFIIPEIVLTVFLLVSGFHFGQEHFERFELPSSVVKFIFITAYGLLVLATLLYLNAADSLPIIHDLIAARITASQVELTMYVLLGITLITGAIVLNKVPIPHLVRELFYLIILYIIFATSSLLWGFAIYFILWHSIPSINSQINHLHGSVSKKTVLLYIKESLLYWIAALMFLGALYYFLNDKTALFLSIIVAFLGGITFPHVFVMHRINKHL